MPLKTKVLISSVTNLSVARYATGMGVNFVGFAMNDEHPGFIGYTNYTAITTWLLDMTFAGEFHLDTPLAFILERAQEFGFTTIITPNSSIVNNLQAKGFQIILRQEVNKTEEVNLLENLTTSADYVLVESATNLILSKENIASLSSKLPLLVGTEISPSTINALIEETDMEGIGLKGSEEIRTGFVDLDAMADLLEAIEVDS